MDKIVVRYSDVVPIQAIIGFRYELYPVDHPSPWVSNTRWTSTSPVVSIDYETGHIETQNTIYVPLNELVLSSFKQYNKPN